MSRPGQTSARAAPCHAAGLSSPLANSGALIPAASGIGYVSLSAAGLLHSEDLRVGLATLSLLGVLFIGASGLAERWAVRWK